MTSTKEVNKELPAPVGLPDCPCFKLAPWERCGDAARIAQALANEMIATASDLGLCRTSLPYVVEIAVVSMLTRVAREQGPALEYGSVEIESEVVRLLTGIEDRVLAKVRHVYGDARARGLTEEVVRAMYQKPEGGLS